MVTVPAPANLNGETLTEELAAQGVTLAGPPTLDADGLHLNVPSASEATTLAVVAAHTGASTKRDQRVLAAIAKLETIAAKTTPTAADTKFLALVLSKVLRLIRVDPD